jgi:hypothetical protein
MNVSLPSDLSPDQREEEAVRCFLEDREPRRLGAVLGIGQAVDGAGLYDKVLVPGRE